MIDLQNHIRNKGAVNLFDGKSTAPKQKPDPDHRVSVRSADPLAPGKKRRNIPAHSQIGKVTR